MEFLTLCFLKWGYLVYTRSNPNILVRHTPQESPDKTDVRQAEEPVVEPPAPDAEPAPSTAPEALPSAKGLLTCKVGFQLMTVLPKR